ncbi:MAG: hypothetical protein AB7O97_18190 [Planctomycetota bacterium]
MHQPHTAARPDRCGPRWFARAFGVLVLAGPVPSQHPARSLELARSLADTRPDAALEYVEHAITQGLDEWQVHVLHAQLLLRTGRLDAARTALDDAQRCLETQRAATAALEVEIARALAAASPAAPAPASASNRDPNPATNLTPLVDPPQDLEAAHRDADALRDAGNTTAAAERYAAVARAGTGTVAARAKNELVAAVRRLVDEAEAIAAERPTDAARQVDTAFQQAETLHDILDDTDRSLEALEPLTRSPDPVTSERAVEVMLDWVDDEIRRSNEAHAAGDGPGSRRYGASSNKVQARLLGSTASLDQQRRSFELRCGAHDPDVRRRALEDYVAWAKGLVRQGEQALREHDRRVAAAKLSFVEKVEAHLYGAGEYSLAAEVTGLLAKSADPEVATAARRRLEDRADSLAERGRQAEDADDHEAAGDLLAAAYRSAPSRTQLGMSAAAAYEKAGRRHQALQQYERLLHAVEQDVAAAARDHIRRLRQWARERYLAVRDEFAAALRAGEAERAVALAEEPLALLENTKLEAAKDAIANGLDARETLEEMGAQLARGGFAPLPAAGDAAGSTVVGRPPEPGRPFVASLDARFEPVAAGPVTLADGTRVTVSQPFWITETRAVDAQVTQYKARLRSFREDAAVSWNNAIMFCLYLTQLEREAGRLPPGYSYTLPTEAEWELLQATTAPSRATADGLPFYEWCLDAVDAAGSSNDPNRDRVDPCRMVGTHRLCRSRHPDHPRRWMVPHMSQTNIGFRVVLAPRPELTPPYRD